MSHKFLPSIKEGVSYCLECGCLSYNNIESKHIIANKNQNIMKMDPRSYQEEFKIGSGVYSFKKAVKKIFIYFIIVFTKK